MKRLMWLSLILLISRSLQAAQGMTLKECYEEARRYNMTVGISEEQIKEAETRFTQALGAVIPKISVVVREELQDPESFSGGTNSTTGFEDTFTRLSTPSVGVSLRQPLFHGLKELHAFKIYRSNRTQKELNLRNAERLLLEDVAIAFYTIAETEKDIARIRTILDVFRKRTAELHQRIQLGKSRPSEIALQETDTSLLEAQLESQLEQRRIAYEMLSFLTGLVPQPPIKVENPIEAHLPPVEQYTGYAQNRPDYMAAKQGINMAELDVKVRKGDLLPQIDMEANYWAYRVGFLRDIKWDIAFNLNAPVFNWETVGQIREAKSRLKQAAMRAEETRRQAVTEIKRAYDSFVGSRKVYAKYKDAAQKAKNSYSLQLQDFSLGLINYLDVLQSQRTFMEALRQRDTAEVATWLDWYKLQVTSGALP